MLEYYYLGEILNHNLMWKFPFIIVAGCQMQNVITNKKKQVKKY